MAKLSLDFTVKKQRTPPLYKDYTKLDTNMQIELQKMLSGASTVDEFSANMSKFMTTIDLSTGMNNKTSRQGRFNDSLYIGRVFLPAS